MSAGSPAPDPRSGVERRAYARFPAAGRLVGTLISQQLPVRVRDVSAGGFSIETMDPHETGHTEAVRFISADDWTAVLEARSLYCRPGVSNSGLPLFVTGFAFVQAGLEHHTVATLLEKVTKVRLQDL